LAKGGASASLSPPLVAPLGADIKIVVCVLRCVQKPCSHTALKNFFKNVAGARTTENDFEVTKI